jgi:hypothetical protein
LFVEKTKVIMQEKKRKIASMKDDEKHINVEGREEKCENVWRRRR